MILFYFLGLATAQLRIPIKASEPKIYSQIADSFNNPAKVLKTSKLYNHQEYLYTAIVKIGSNKQSFNLDIDTGSSTLWVERYDCTECEGFKHQFNPSASSTFKTSLVQQTIYYGDGSYVNGNISTDLVFIGDDIVLNTTTNFLLVSNDSMSGGDDDTNDGLVGLGFKQLNFNYPTLIDSLLASKSISRRVFAIYLNHLGKLGDESGYGDNPSTLEIGSYDYKKYTGTSNPTINTVQISNTGYWSTNDIVGLKIDGLSLASPTPIIFDSGTTLIVIDTLTFASIYNYLSDDYNCEQSDDGTLMGCECSSTSSMPSMYFKFNSFDIKVPDSRLWLYSKGFCVLLATPSDFNFWILGDVFLQDYYMVYDMDNMTVSITETDFGDSSSSWASALVVSGILVISSLI